MTELWPPKVGLSNQNHIWRGVSKENYGLNFDRQMAFTIFKKCLGMTVRQSSILTL